MIGNGIRSEKRKKNINVFCLDYGAGGLSRETYFIHISDRNKNRYVTMLLIVNALNWLT